MSHSPYEGLAEKLRGGKSASSREFENRKPIIKLSRKSDRGGFSFRKLMMILSIYEMCVDAFPYRIFVDGELSASLEPGESVELQLDAGQHEILIKTPFAWNRKRLDVEMGHVSKYFCQSSMTGIVFWRR